MLTLTLHSVPVNTGTAHHYIVNDRETALAADPVALAVLEPAIRQYSRLVERHSAAILGLGELQLLRMEELPYRAIDDLIRGVTQDVDNGVRGVQDVGLFGEVCDHKHHAFAETLTGTYRGW